MTWNNVFFCLLGAMIGVIISTAIDLGFVLRSFREVAECRATLADPDHCISYCVDALEKFGC